jgi:hypothetical protein
MFETLNCLFELFYSMVELLPPLTLQFNLNQGVGRRCYIFPPGVQLARIKVLEERRRGKNRSIHIACHYGALTQHFRLTTPPYLPAVFPSNVPTQTRIKGTVQRELRWVKIGINRTARINCIAGKCHLPGPKGHHHESIINVSGGCSTF